MEGQITPRTGLKWFELIRSCFFCGFLKKLGVPMPIGRSRLPIGRSRLLLGVLGYGLGVPDCLLGVPDYLLMLDA